MALALVLAVGCGAGGGGGGTSSACQAAEERLQQAQDAVAAAQEPSQLREAIEERAAAAEVYNEAC